MRLGRMSGFSGAKPEQIHYVDHKEMLPINKLCHKVSCISRPSEEAASREAKIKVVTKHNFSKFLGLFRLIKVVTAKVQPEKITGRTPC